jgi:serine/threonine-protein kinase HipA
MPARIIADDGSSNVMSENLKLVKWITLLYAPDDRAGALGFGLGKIPPAPRRKFNQTLDLEKLQTIADAIVQDEELPPNAAAEKIEELMLIGTSMGGARPKAIIENEDGLWLAKFNKPDDKWNSARVEHAMLVLATLGVVHVPAAPTEAIIAEMENQIVRTWYEVSRGEGVSEQDCKQIAGAFAYPGFRLEHQNRRSK